MQRTTFALCALLALLLGCVSAPDSLDSSEPPFAILTLKVAG